MALPMQLKRIAAELLRGNSNQKGRTDTPAGEFTGDFPSFEEAAQHAVGYDTDVIAASAESNLIELLGCLSTQTETHVLYQQAHSAICFARDRLGSKRLSVLDVGGGNGNYFCQLSRLMPGIELQWTIVETAKVVSRCAPLLPQVRFSTTIPDERFDIALVSGVLQYLPDAHEVLKKCTSKARWVILARIPVHDGNQDRFMVQHVPAAIFLGTLPFRVFSLSDLDQHLEKIGTKILSWANHWDDPSLQVVGCRAIGFLLETLGSAPL